MGVRNGGRSRARLLIGLVLVAGVGWVATAPLFRRAKEHDHPPSCASHLKHLALACRNYALDWDGRFPAAAAPLSAGGPDVLWPGRLLPYRLRTELFVCPQQPERRDLLDEEVLDDHAWPLTAQAMPPEWRPWQPQPIACGYLYNRDLAPHGVGVRSEEILHPEQVFLLDDGVWPTGGGSTLERLRVIRAVRHNGGAMIAFADGHVKWQRLSQVAALQYAP